MNHGVLFKISIFSDMCKFVTSLDFWFPSILILSSQIFQVLSYSENVVPLKISSYSVTFVSKDSALSFSVAAKTLNLKSLIPYKLESILWEHRTKNVSLEVKWIENPVPKAISALKTRKL